MKTFYLTEGNRAPALVVPIIQLSDKEPFVLPGKTVLFQMVDHEDETVFIIDNQPMTQAEVWCPEIQQIVTAAVYLWRKWTQTELDDSRGG